MLRCGSLPHHSRSSHGLTLDSDLFRIETYLQWPSTQIVKQPNRRSKSGSPRPSSSVICFKQASACQAVNTGRIVNGECLAISVHGHLCIMTGRHGYPCSRTGRPSMRRCSLPSNRNGKPRQDQSNSTSDPEDDGAGHGPHRRPDFAALADLMSAQARNSSSLLEGLKSSSQRNAMIASRAEDVASAPSVQARNAGIFHKGLKSTSRPKGMEGSHADGMVSAVQGKTLKSRVTSERDVAISRNDNGSQATLISETNNGVHKDYHRSQTTLASQQEHDNNSRSTNAFENGLNKGADKWLRSHETIESAPSKSTQKPVLSGQDVLLALQKASLHKTKQKKRNRKGSDKAETLKDATISQNIVDWTRARPITIKVEWASQIEDLERRIKDLKDSMPT